VAFYVLLCREETTHSLSHSQVVSIILTVP